VNNTDRELLELAAIAADLQPQWNGDRLEVVQMFRGHLENWSDWNPLEDDGDALRLAVALLEYEPFRSRGGFLMSSSNDLVKHRRAIVVAAAQIGETIKVLPNA